MKKKKKNLLIETRAPVADFARRTGCGQYANENHRTPNRYTTAAAATTTKFSPHSPRMTRYNNTRYNALRYVFQLINWSRNGGGRVYK